MPSLTRDSEKAAIERFIAEQGVTRHLPPRLPPHGGHPRRLGARYANGHIKPEYGARLADRGHEMTRLHRAESVDPDSAEKMREAIERRRISEAASPEISGLEHERAEARKQVRLSSESSLRAGDSKASYIIGRMLLAGLLADPDDSNPERREETAIGRHRAAYDFALMHFRLFGPCTAPSHLRNAVAGMLASRSFSGDTDDSLGALAAKFGRWYAAAMITPPCGRLLGHMVLERAALYEMAPDNRADEATLRRVLDRLARNP